jgi:small conductance mechanosensitive channel
LEQLQADLINAAKDAGRYVLDALLSIGIAIALLLGSRFIRQRIKSSASKRHVRNNLPSLIDNVIRIGVYIVVLLIVLGSLGVDTSSLVTFFSVFTAALTLSLQDVLKNIFSGMYLLGEQPFLPGDRIKVAKEEGRVERIDLRVTRIRSDRQELILVPNLTVFTQVVANSSTLRFRPMTFQIIDIDEDVEVAEDGIRETVKPHIPDGARVAIRLMKVGKEGCDLEATIRRTETEEQQHTILLALHKRFPGATLTVVGR